MHTVDTGPAPITERERRLVASRDFTTDNGNMTLRILASADGSPAFEYQLVDARGDLLESLETPGADTIQALLFCIAAAGDYLRRFVPSASFAGLGTTGLLETDLAASDEWAATVTMPAVPPEA